jgi:hypothetical protein
VDWAAFATHDDPRKKVYNCIHTSDTLISSFISSPPTMTSTTQLNTSSLSRDFKNDTVNNSSQLNTARNTPPSFRPSGVTRESRANNSANPVQAPACVLPLLRPTKGTDVYISMRADGTHDSTASGLFFSPSFLAASDQVSFDESLSDWIPGGEGRAG